MSDEAKYKEYQSKLRSPHATFNGSHNRVKSKLFMFLDIHPRKPGHEYMSIKGIAESSGITKNYLRCRAPLLAGWRYLADQPIRDGSKAVMGYALDQRGRLFLTERMPLALWWEIACELMALHPEYEERLRLRYILKAKAMGLWDEADAEEPMPVVADPSYPGGVPVEGDEDEELEPVEGDPLPRWLCWLSGKSKIAWDWAFNDDKVVRRGKWPPVDSLIVAGIDAARELVSAWRVDEFGDSLSAKDYSAQFRPGAAVDDEGGEPEPVDKPPWEPPRYLVWRDFYGWVLYIEWAVSNKHVVLGNPSRGYDSTPEPYEWVHNEEAALHLRDKYLRWASDKKAEVDELAARQSGIPG